MGKEGVCTQGKAMSIFKTISLSVKAICSEVHFNVIKALRKWEIRELKKRLDREYLTLGKLYYNLKEDDEETLKKIELAKNQIDFLEEEISSLEKEISTLREKIVEDRSKDI